MDIKKSWKVPKIDFDETAAIQALNRGEATKEQQEKVLKCIIEKMCGYNDEQFNPESSRFTDYHLGRRSVASLLLKEIAIDLVKLSEKRRSQ